MELYGGGMTGEPTNYQIGGAVSRAKISSKYLSDYNKVKEAYDENIKNMGFLSNLGTIGGFIADLYLPGSGGVVKGVAESFYRPEEVGDVDFALKQKGEVGDISDAYRKGIFERGLTSSLSSLLMSDIYKGIGEKAKVGLEGVPEKVADWGADKPMFLGEEGARRWGIGGKEFAKGVRERAFADKRMPWLTEDWQTSLSPEPWAGGGLMDSVTPQYAYGGRMQFGDTQQNQFMPQKNQFASQTQQDLTPDLSNTDFSALQGWQMFGSDNPVFGPDTDWSGLPIEGIPPNTPTTNQKTPGSAGTFSPYGDYGRQRSVAGALTAAGMGEKMKDPEFEKYMQYLPTFDMGYEQKIADYRTGAQGSLFGMTAPMGAGETTFSGSGAVKKARETGRKQTTDIYGRQERGVGEEYIKDVLAALTAAETAKNGAFEAPEAGGKVDPPEDPAQTQYEQWKTHNGRKWKWDVNNKWWEDMGPG